MPKKQPRLEAEIVALRIQQERGFVTKEQLLQVLRLIPGAEWTPRWGGKSFHFGAFQRVTTGQRASSRRYPLTTRLCTRFVTQWMPDAKFTTITVHDNVATPPHTDARNSEVPGGLVALTNSFTGGELWLEHDRGTHTMTIKGKAKLGIKVDLTSPFAFSAKTVLHATVPWMGDRWILTAYSISNVAANLSLETTWGLISLGFRPPTPADEERFKYEQWGATISRQLRFAPRAVWPRGVLLQHGPVEPIDLEGEECPPTIDLLTDSESDVVSLCLAGGSPEPDYWQCILSDLEE